MNMDESTAQPGTTVAYRNDGSQLIYDYTSEDGFDIGHILMPDGTSARQSPVISILAHGYWTVEPTDD